MKLNFIDRQKLNVEMMKKNLFDDDNNYKWKSREKILI